MKELALHPKVRTDLFTAYDWYEQQRPGLGEDFLGCVKATLAAIRRAPQSYARVSDVTRRAVVRRFPYSVFFVVEADRLLVLGVLHSSRAPDTWRDRN